MVSPEEDPACRCRCLVLLVVLLLLVLPRTRGYRETPRCRPAGPAAWNTDVSWAQRRRVRRREGVWQWADAASAGEISGGIREKWHFWAGGIGRRTRRGNPRACRLFGKCDAYTQEFSHTVFGLVYPPLPAHAPFFHTSASNFSTFYLESERTPSFRNQSPQGRACATERAGWVPTTATT